MNMLDQLADPAARAAAFPVSREWAYFANAGVCPLPRCAADAITEFIQRGASGCQENSWSAQQAGQARKLAAQLLSCDAKEIALLGPTSLGISLVARGIEWNPGDEVVYYQDDYPANVYPWRDLEREGVTPVALQPEHPGAITWDVVEAALSERTRLVALATCHFLSGYRVDVEGIAKRLKERDILVSIDGIQTLGAFPLNVEHIDFLSADSHKWLLGPVGAGIFYVKRERQTDLRPMLLGSWNVISPEFIAQEDIKFQNSAVRYEPGTLNLPGIAGMAASMDMILEAGVENIAKRILELRRHLLDSVRPFGWRHYLEDLDEAGKLEDINRSGIVSLYHPDKDLDALFKKLKENGVFASLRQNRKGDKFIRFSTHFYNTTGEIDRAVELLQE